jgi:hypothetical protein
MKKQKANDESQEHRKNGPEQALAEAYLPSDFIIRICHPVLFSQSIDLSIAAGSRLDGNAGSG